MRSYDRGHTLDLIAAGVDYQIRETFESAMTFGEAALIELGVPAEEAADVAEGVRHRDAERLKLQMVDGIARRPRPDPQERADADAAASRRRCSPPGPRGGRKCPKLTGSPEILGRRAAGSCPQSQDGGDRLHASLPRSCNCAGRLFGRGRRRRHHHCLISGTGREGTTLIVMEYAPPLTTGSRRVGHH